MDNGVEVSDDAGKTKVLNRQFKSVFTKEPATSGLSNKGTSPHPDICHFTIVEEGVLHFLSTLNIHKACGPDQINKIFLKQTSTVITPLITNLFQMPLHSGEIPDDWKIAYASQIFKKFDLKIRS